MPRGLTFADVRAIGQTMPGVEEATAHGSPALKVDGKMLACIAINKAAEPNSLVVRISNADREELLAAEPSVYYLKPHYEPYPSVLVRLSKVRRDALQDLLSMSARFVQATTRKRRAPRARTARPARRGKSA